MEHLRLMQICYQVYLGNFLFVTLAYVGLVFYKHPSVTHMRTVYCRLLLQ